MKNIKTLKFWAPWCKPCTALSVQLEGLEITSYNVDLPESAAALKKYQIKNIPALVFVEVTEVDKKEVETEIHRHLGMISRQAYLDTVDALVYEKINPDYQQMVENLGSPRAESLYTQVIDFTKSGVDSLRFMCDQEGMLSIYGKLSNNIEDFVSMLNEEGSRFKEFGVYFNNGDGRVRLDIIPEQMENLKGKCPDGEITLFAYWD
jgi:thiol-disulfide isomerase/thioredoxin